MNQYDFDALLQKYLSGECSPKEESQVLEWSENMLKHSNILINSAEKQIIEKRLWDRLNISKRRYSIFSNNIFKTGIAAVFLIACLSLTFLFWQRSLPEKLVSKNPAQDKTVLPFIKGNIEVKNTSDKPYKIVLEDKSVVVLKPKSGLSYPEHFDKKSRVVYLNGEAFFAIEKDPSKPFLVNAGELVTQVLGTSFNIKSYGSAKSIEVAVVTGRVSIYENTQTSPQTRNGIILNPNQKITFDKESKILIPELVTEPIIVHPSNNKLKFIFEETPLPNVLSAIQDAYGIEIVIEAANLNNCVFTGDINELPLYSQLKFICKAVNANYELRGTTFFLNGEGCHKN